MKSINQWCKYIQEAGEPGETGEGNPIWRQFRSADRYCVDFSESFVTERWLQFDTSQDAHYFGVWVNPKTLTTLSYAEGDWSVVQCLSWDAYLGEIRSMISFYDEGFVAKTIDLDGSLTVYRQDRKAFLEEPT